MRTLAIIALAGGFLCGLFVREAPAIQDITSCNTTCTENCRVPNPLTCCSNTNTPQCKGLGPIVLPSGYDLDVNSTITCFCGTKTCNGGANNNALCTVDSQCPGGTCSDQTGCTTCGAAVTMTSNGSIVKSNANNGLITGPFANAVDCDSRSGSRVTGVKFENLYGSGTLDCAQVDGNVFAYGNGGGSTAVLVWDGVASSDSIHDNYIDGWYDAISVSSFSGSIDHNMIIGRSSRFGIFDYTGSSTIESNVFHGSFIHEDPDDCGTLFCIEQGIILGSFLTAENYCDPTDPGCPFCIEQGLCAQATAPFALP